MAHFVHSFGLALGITTALILAGLFYMDRKTSFTQQLSFQPTDQVDVNESREEESLPNDHPDLIFLRQFGRVKNLPSPEEMRNMRARELFYIYHSYLDNTDYHCRRKLRMGNAGDGGWEVCDDFLYRPVKPCIVYSFGINYDFSFDDDVGRIYGCQVHSFDPSMGKKSHNRSKAVRFYAVGLGGAGGRLPSDVTATRGQDKWTVRTLAEIITMLQHRHMTIDVLKMDIEHSEWPALEDMGPGELSRVRQLLVEFHHHPRSWLVRDKLAVLYKLEVLGFRRFYTHVNPSGPRQRVFLVDRRPFYEIGFINSCLPRH